MKLNCKVGDLAVVVRSVAGNEGRIVRCVEFLPAFEFARGAFDSWATEPMLRNKAGMYMPTADFQLRPIRPQADDARDETLSWKRVPSPVKQGVEA